MKSVLKNLFSTALYILFIIGMTWFIITFVGQRTDVHGSSMESTLHDGDSLWVSKVSYRLGDPERFDVVVFPYQYAEETYYIKRIIGLPGETVRIDEEGTIYINGEVLRESYGREVIRADHLGRASEDVLLGEDEYFVMGDNRNDSIDSRYDVVGNIKREDLIGKAVFRMFPVSSFGKFE